MDGKHKYVHRLVADAFFEGEHKGKHVNHIDGDKTNNDVSNLEFQEIRGYSHTIHAKVVKCKFCKHRGEYDICYGQDDDFFCSHGQE